VPAEFAISERQTQTAQVESHERDGERRGGLAPVAYSRFGLAVVASTTCLCLVWLITIGCARKQPTSGWDVDRTAVIALCLGGWLLPGFADAMRDVSLFRATG
jgi:hypothetical protein